ncbi:MAG TPA: SpvB/TcaC N-terminal domain-containing protein, partial [Longimicrobium sp.]|nr:SpvB/TcaC N-terminal domain-containing protein [Longimicrobium sp.]
MNTPGGDGAGQAQDRISTPALSLPPGGGAVRGVGESFQSQEFSGAATFSIPIPASRARALTPELTLSYSSGAGNGVFGMGFGVGLPSIARETSSGIPRYTDDDVFILSDQGDLAPARAADGRGGWVPDRRAEPAESPVYQVAAYRPRREAVFSRIERWSRLDTGESHWRVLTRDNTVHWYGRTADSRIADPADPGRVFQWLLDETVDARGNRCRYGYRAEDGANLPADPCEAGRDHRANRYPATIEYGNYFAGGVERFAFRLVFDYGERSLDDPEAPPGTWAARPDPFSSYRSGFELRTLRLCRTILLYHCFHDRFGGVPFLTRALSLEYHRATEAGEPGAGLSFIAAATETGFRRGDDGSYTRKAMPPVTFGYTPFQPAGQAWTRLEVEGGGALPGYLDAGAFLPVDLRGEGLPGLLYGDGTATLQWEPLGGGRYSGPHVPDRFPVERDLRDSRVVVTSLAGNGEPDLLVRTPARSGFYRFAGGRAWEPFQPFRSAPVEVNDPLTEMVDLDGDGRADLLAFGPEQLRGYPSLGLDGYGPPEPAPREPGFPVAADPGREEVLTFADLFGDGLAHRVRVRDGMVECWPNLGHGRFGARVVMGNAPAFGGVFDARRLFLVDVAGSGMADLVYATVDRVQVWFNQSGNRFSDPLTIFLPAPFDELSRMSFADVNGNGTTCLILSRPTPGADHHVYDFAGDVKPYLLCEVDNHRGARTRVTYGTSVKQYLEDRRAGRAWATPLFFPVQVVQSVEQVDAVSGSRHVTRHSYHDGYYDPVEREFRGFGYVETWDTETYDDFVAAAAAPAVRRTDAALYVPPTCTRSWFHTGALPGDGLVSRRYAGEYWSGDPRAYTLPGSVFDPEVHRGDPETLRQAYVALAGELLRQETYGLDGSPAAAHPYAVTESSVRVRLVQPCAGGAYAVFLPFTLESLTSRYERVPADPRVQHDLTLAVDDYGNVARRCSLFYPRRADAAGRAVYPEQSVLRAVLTEEGFVNHAETAAEPYRWLGVRCESRSYEVEGLAASGQLSWEALAAQVDEALREPLDYGQPFTSGAQARLFAWTRAYRWNEEQSGAAPLGAVSPRGLDHHVETAAATAELFQAALEGKLDADRVAGGAGYWLDAGYWWNRGLIQHCFPEPERFFLPCATDGAFAEVEAESSLNPLTTLEYDAYALLVTGSAKYVSGSPAAGDAAVALATAVENDYQAVSPCRITDPNGAVSEVRFDPLRMVVATSLYGMEGGSPAGDDPLPAEPAGSGATLQAVLADPAGHLGAATSFFFYDLLAWLERGEPAAAVGLLRHTHVHAPADGASRIQVELVYSDGFGRAVESKLLADPAPGATAPRWIVSGRTTYNNKGKPAEQHFPTFSGTPGYEGPRAPGAPAAVPPTVLHYDPLGRVVRTDTPKGFFTRVEYSPWRVTRYDEDDTVCESAYYQSFPARPATQAGQDERDALDKAARFHGTPTVEVLDNQGRTVRTVQDNLGAVSAGDLAGVAAGPGLTAPQLWYRLAAAGYLAVDPATPTQAWVTEKVRPCDAAFRQELDEQFGALAAPLLDLLRAGRLTTLRELDAAGREVRAVDPRLLYANATRGTAYQNLARVLDMAGNALVSDSADAGRTLALLDVFGGHFWNWSPRSFEQWVTFDRTRRRTAVRVKGYRSDGTPAADNLVEVFTYGETQPDAARFNLRGRLYTLRDQSGTVVHGGYGLMGDVLETTRRFTVDYRESVSWAPEPPLEPEGYTTRSAFNALRAQVAETAPDGSVTRWSYGQAGLLASLAVTLADGTVQGVIDAVEYDANRQRTSVTYANGVTTTFGYEATTLRLLAVHSERSGSDAEGNARDPVLQEIAYTCDPVGNVTRTRDASWQTVFSGNQRVEPLADYGYDALYRLVAASGRQHPGITAATFRNNTADGDFKQSRFFALPGGPGALESYGERYGYDDGGNLLATRHTAASASWTRAQTVADDSNRLVGTGAANGVAFSDAVGYDASGNQRRLSIDNAVELTWNCCENLVCARIIQRPGELDDADYYTYGQDERRTRKVCERMANGGSVVRKETTLYLGRYQVKRVSSVAAGGETTILARRTLRVMDGGRCVAILHIWDQDDPQREVARPGTRSARFQLGDSLGSVAMEVDGGARIISYEEYFPYGGTSFVAGSDITEVRLKDYRYGGKERDDTTGLYDYGARYYAPWLGRWLKPDPAGNVDGLNTYAFVRGNPLRYVDPQGLASHGTNVGNKYEWEVQNHGSYHAADANVAEMIARFGHPSQSVVQKYDDLASRVGYDVTHGGVLQAGTLWDLGQAFEASLPLHFN